MNELSNEARALVELARTSDGPSAGDRHLVRAGLAASGAALALSASVQATAQAASALGSAAATKTVLVAAPAVATGLGAITSHVIVPGIVGMVIGGALAAPLLLKDPAPERPSVPVPSVQSAAHSPQVPRAVVHAPVPEPASSRPAPSAVSAAVPDSLQEETELLVRAQRELSSGRAEGALELLDEHERRFPRGSLAQERAASRVFSLCRAGRALEARAHAQRFLQAAPTSPVAPRIRRSCAFSEPVPENAGGITELPAGGHSAPEQQEQSP
ncbi:MAG TPA: hypothetical protein VK524_23905 [Polyangiaceae bacterium]|nr:hypothetical protein [Polyangiaceae bacterium]